MKWLAFLVGLVVLVGGCSRVLEEGVRGEIGAVVEREVAAGNVPGAVVLVGDREGVLFVEAYGSEVVEPYVEGMEAGTIFDIASLSKPVATATSVLILVDRGELRLGDRVVEYLPEFGQGGKEGVEVRHLLGHCSGLPAYVGAGGIEAEHGAVCPDAVVAKICSLEARSRPGEEFVYSCLGYITLGRIVEVVSGQGLDEFARENIFAPVGMRETYYNPPGRLAGRIAATENRGGEAVRGLVHDPLARLMGGVSGNAGVFTTAGDLGRYCRMVLGGGVIDGRRVLSEEAVGWLTEEQCFEEGAGGDGRGARESEIRSTKSEIRNNVQSTNVPMIETGEEEGAGEEWCHGRAFGFDVGSGYSWIKGEGFGAGAFCHSGYTGTSMVCDPGSGRYLVVLSNRAHPADGGTVRGLRVELAEIVGGVGRSGGF